MTYLESRLITVHGTIINVLFLSSCLAPYHPFLMLFLRPPKIPFLAEKTLFFSKSLHMSKKSSTFALAKVTASIRGPRNDLFVLGRAKHPSTVMSL